MWPFKPREENIQNLTKDCNKLWLFGKSCGKILNKLILLSILKTIKHPI